MERGKLVTLIVCLIYVYVADSIELLANYKYWKSTSDQLTFDYSGNSRHAILIDSYMVTDRGLSPNKYYYPSLMSYKNPGMSDYTFSFWMLNNANLGRFWFSISPNSASRFFSLEYILSASSFELKLKMFNPYLLVRTLPIDMFSGWNLHTVRLYLDSNIPDRANIVLYKNLVHFHTDYIDIGQTFTKFNTLLLGNQEDSPDLILILYELWIHTGFSSISELSSLLSVYGCPASPNTACLPTYPKTMNKLGQACSSSCTTNNLSCDSNKICINKSKSECQYGLYDLETFECLFYCPYNSCICPARLTQSSQSYTAFSCSCNNGYKKISDDPPACISIRCLSYTKVGYNYVCNTNESGYTLDSLGNCCVCSQGFTSVSSNPLICVNTSICINHIISGGDYICSSCSEGYSLDSDGKCNACSSNYVDVMANPFTCIPKIEKCREYIYNSNYWICKVCSQGYSVDENFMCNKCQDGYFTLIDTPFTCIFEVKHCVSYEQDGENWNCKECEEPYQLTISGDCDQCKLGYVKVESENPLCKKEIDHCIEYDLYSEESKCTLCGDGYTIDTEYSCNTCESGYIYISLNPLVCDMEILHCISYSSSEDRLECLECESGYILQSKCVLEIPFCSEYTVIKDQYLCTTCEAGYELEGNECKNHNVLTCNKGYYLNTDNTCKECSNNCIECKLGDTNEDICSECEYGFDLKSGKCETAEKEESLDSSLTQFTQVASVASVSVSLASLNINNILSMIGTIQILNYILLYNLHIPLRAKTILEGISIFQILPNLCEYFINAQDNLDIERYNRLDINNELFLINAGKMLTIIVLIIILIIILKLIAHFIKELEDESIIQKSIAKLLSFLEWNFVIGYFIPATLELTIFALINIYHVSFYSIHSVVGFSISILVLVKSI